MQGFVKSYFNQQRMCSIRRRSCITSAQKQLPVLTTLALEFAVFNRWFASIPGPTVCNRSFAHFGTSFGRVDMNPVYVGEPFQHIYGRLIKANAKAHV
jgi:phospholipase C